MIIKQAAIWNDEFLENTTAVMAMKNLIGRNEGLSQGERKREREREK
jgi:hypothetical protein